MDFLDPSKKRAHNIRLHIGYFLMSIVVVLGTLLFFSIANGFNIDRQTGTLYQNGTIYVDSKPKGGRVFVNNIEQSNRTDTRLDLPAGSYTIRIQADGFRYWERTIDLSGGEIERLVYPYLIPNQFVTTDVATFSSLPSLETQSPDRRWLLLMKPDSVGSFDLYDLADEKKPAVNISIPEEILTASESGSTIKFIEWSTDNRHILFERVYDGETEFIMFDRENPSASININTTLGIKPVVISLKNKRPDQFYYLDSLPGILRVADTKSKTISAPMLDGVIDYKSYGDDIVLYATQKDVSTEGRTDFRILEGNTSYTLKNVAQSDRYVMDVSKYENQWYYAVGSSSENMTFVYEDPISSLKKKEQTPLNVVAIMRLENPRFVSFSAGTQFIGVQSGSKLLTLDLDKSHLYRLNLGVDVPIDTQVKWMDGHRYMFSSNGQSYIVDFDGSNEQTLVTSLSSTGPFFDRDYDNVFTIEDSKSTVGKKALTRTVVDDR